MYACFLLNISDQANDSFEQYKYIWDEADLKLAVDGAANFLAKRRALHTADVISGDFDSIDVKLIERLQSPRKAIKPPSGAKNSGDTPPQRMPQIVETSCQKETDFTKALRVAIGLKPELQFFFGLYYSDGMRMDHLFGLVNTLHLIKKNIFILNIQSNTISWLLQPGTHFILKPRGQELCSLVPFTGPAETKTQGLQYNLNPTVPLSFGGIVSTSNFCQESSNKIFIDTNRQVLWSIDLTYTKQDGVNLK